MNLLRESAYTELPKLRLYNCAYGSTYLRKTVILVRPCRPGTDPSYRSILYEVDADDEMRVPIHVV